MADNSDSRESDNNSWVIPGSEALPVEDLGLAASEESLLEVDPCMEILQAPPDEDKPLVSHHPDLEESKPELPAPETRESEATPDSHPKEETPDSDPLKRPVSLHATASGEAQGSEDAARPELQRTIFIHKAGPLGDEPSSGEDSAKERDIEGLRRRKGRDTPLPGTWDGRDQGRKAPGNEDAGLLQTKWTLGFLALLGLGLLAFLGVTLDVDESPVDILSAWSSSESEELQDFPAAPGPDPAGVPHLHRAKEASTAAPGDTRSLESMSALLDKLAKENQDIRLMQAELQAQKEELQALLRKAEGESQAASPTSQQESLAAENAKLTEALRREVSSLQAAQAELRLLREKLQGPAEAGSQGHHGEGPMPDRHHKPKHPEIERLRSLLASVQQDLARAFEKVPPGDGARRLRTELNEVEQRLAKELDGLAKERTGWRESYKARRGKERTWHRKHEGRWPGPGEEGPRSEHHAGHRVPKMADGPHHHRKQPSPQDAKPHWKSRKAKKPTEPSALWETLARHQYPAPPVCAGVTECAQQEGLRPVEKASFLPMVQSYLAGLGWAEHYRGLAAALGGHFGSDGVFAHDRLSFVEFLDEIEDALEDLAELLGVSEEEVDNFEDVILGQLGAAPGGRSMQPDGGQHHAKEWNRAGHGAREDGKKFPGQPRG